MANLGIYKIEANDDYKSIETETGETFTVGTTYTMQLLKPAVICRASSKPTDGGFLIDTTRPFQYTPNGSDTLYIKTEGLFTFLNIDEGE